MTHPTRRTSRTRTATTERATLPPSRAFVVQMRADAEAAHGVFAGRVEHITSGAAAPFETLKQLIDFIRKTLEHA